ncbi:integrase arm-type DNA-binding domain-containing protein [Avibacterium paragallinarum]|uniref:tyrosine-type recombinase/integrase n=1 Tax=Avibacterium paragallinarum TaxID=728 RepID=UPI0021F6E099|nr:integrase arm-type DNA-binding domain-containing protein [Avibacterium paragallinarum]UXN34627.1 integrase arm-type DNA-binding domain-containing protein [Avibacterium paragallinarum]
MARKTQQLTDTQIRKARADNKEITLSDGNGLFIVVALSQSKIWHFKYTNPRTKKRTKKTIGRYPAITLAQARAKRDEYQSLLAQGIDPKDYEQQQNQQQANALNNTFEKVALNWFEDRKLKPDFSERTAQDTWKRFNRHILPTLGNYPIQEITPLMAINALKPLELAGKYTELSKVVTKINEVMTYALHRGIISTNNLAKIGKEFTKPTPQGMNTIEPQELESFITAFYQAKENNHFSPLSFYAVLLVLLTGGRPSEIAGAKWADIDFSENLWAYRVQKGNKNLKGGRLHIVTLSRQAVAVLQKMREISTALNLSGDFVFPSVTAKSGHITIEAMRKAIIKTLGKGKLTTHGIRHLISTSLNERDYNADWIEKALSHKGKDRIRDIYNKAKYLEQRAEMLQDWGDYVESLAPKPFV